MSVQTWEEREAWSGGLGAVSCVFFFHVFDSSSSLLSAPLAAVSGAMSSYTERFHPWPTDAGICGTVMFWGFKIKKCLHASLPVCLRVILSSGDSHTVSLVFLLLISVRRRMVGECQLSLKHLFPANNSLCRCLILADRSPIVSSLLTQNNNADECHLLVMYFFPPLCLKRSVPALHCSSHRLCSWAAAELLTAALPDVLDGPGLAVPWSCPLRAPQLVVCRRLCEIWAGLPLKVGGHFLAQLPLYLPLSWIPLLLFQKLCHHCAFILRHQSLLNVNFKP